MYKVLVSYLVRCPWTHSHQGHLGLCQGRNFQKTRALVRSALEQEVLVCGWSSLDVGRPSRVETSKIISHARASVGWDSLTMLPWETSEPCVVRNCCCRGQLVKQNPSCLRERREPWHRGRWRHLHTTGPGNEVNIQIIKTGFSLWIRELQIQKHL